jgi:hypothetical protein
LLFLFVIPEDLLFVFAVASFLSPNPKSCHFDRSSSRLCELRSGETRFSAQASSQSILLFACRANQYRKKKAPDESGAFPFRAN